MQLGLEDSAPANVAVNELMMKRGIGLPSVSLRWPVSMTCEMSVLTSIRSPTLARSGSLTRGLVMYAVLRLAYPPQPPTVTFTDRRVIRNLPSLSSAKPITSCVCARRMRLAADALPDSNVKRKVATFGAGLAVEIT